MFHHSSLREGLLFSEPPDNIDDFGCHLDDFECHLDDFECHLAIVSVLLLLFFLELWVYYFLDSLLKVICLNFLLVGCRGDECEESGAYCSC